MGGIALVKGQLCIVTDPVRIRSIEGDNHIQLPGFQRNGPGRLFRNHFKNQPVVFGSRLRVKIIVKFHQGKRCARGPVLKLIWAASHGGAFQSLPFRIQPFHIRFAEDGASGMVQGRNQRIGRGIHVNNKVGVIHHLHTVDHRYQVPDLGGLFLPLQGELYIFRRQSFPVMELDAFFQRKFHGYVIFKFPAFRQVAHKRIIRGQLDQIIVNMPGGIGRYGIVMIMGVQGS